jgi:hypothetical protein
LEQCEQAKASLKEEYEQQCKQKLDKMQTKVDAATTRATISKRGFDLCKGDLAAANAQGESMQAEVMKKQAELAKQTANTKAKEKEMRTEVTSDVADKVQAEERERYDRKLDKAVTKISKKMPISPKCVACAKLSNAERAVTAAQCAGCPS